MMDWVYMPSKSYSVGNSCVKFDYDLSRRLSFKKNYCLRELQETSRKGNPKVILISSYKQVTYVLYQYNISNRTLNCHTIISTSNQIFFTMQLPYYQQYNSMFRWWEGATTVSQHFLVKTKQVKSTKNVVVIGHLIFSIHSQSICRIWSFPIPDLWCVGLPSYFTKSVGCCHSPLFLLLQPYTKLIAS